MAGRPPKSDDEKKIREAIYFEPHLHEWLKVASGKGTISVFVNKLVEDAKNSTSP